MKIGIASPIYLKSLSNYLNLTEDESKLGLGATAVNAIVIGLLEEGHEVSIYSLDHNVRSPKFFSGRNLKVYLGNFRNSGYMRSGTLFNNEVKQILKFIRIDNPDIVNAHWSYEYAVAAIKSKRPHLITFRDDSNEILKHYKDFYRVSRYLIDHWVRLKGKNFNVNSIYLQNQLSSFKKDIPVIPNPIDSSLILTNPKQLPDKKVRIISILNGLNRKNPYKAIKAFAQIRKKYHSRVEYHLVGNGYNNNGRVHKWAIENNLEDGLKFLGIVEYKTLMKNLANYEILLHPSLEESFGNTLLEGMAKGLPVIGGKDSGAVPWVLNYGKNGVLTDVNSEDEIANSIDYLIQNKDIYHQLSKQGLSYIYNFTPKKIASKYYSLYNKVLKEKTNIIN